MHACLAVWCEAARAASDKLRVWEKWWYVSGALGQVNNEESQPPCRSCTRRPRFRMSSGGTSGAQGQCVSTKSIGHACVKAVRQRADVPREPRCAYLLLMSHPFATKLLSVTSAAAFVIFDLRELTSRRAARDETQKDSLGASMICSSCKGQEQGRVRDSINKGYYENWIGRRTTALKYAISSAL